MHSNFKKLLIPASSAAAGGLIVFGLIASHPDLLRNKKGEPIEFQNNKISADQFFKNQELGKANLDQFFNDENFLQGDPFEQMRKIQGQLQNRMKGEKWTALDAPNPIDNISKREDDHSVYYDIKVPDIQATSIKTKIENGAITIAGTIEKTTPTNEKENANFQEQSVFKSTFQRTFPLPEHVDENKMQMISEGNKIVLKFPKIRS